MVSSMVPVPGCYQASPLPADSSVAASACDPAFSERCSPAKGSLTGLILGAGFWAALLVMIFRH